MSCASSCVKYLLFIFNFLFALGGLAILVCGVLIHVSVFNLASTNIDIQISMPVVVLIIVGAIIFIIAFFGCCGAIRESHCMIITFAVLLLTLLVVQVAIASYAFVQFKGTDVEEKVNDMIKEFVDKYFDDKKYQDGVSALQGAAHCCGYTSYKDFLENPKNTNALIPYTCCGKNENSTCSIAEVSSVEGCKTKVFPLFKNFSDGLAGLALSIAAVELIGIIFSFCLANSIRNVQRRGYKV